MIKLIVCCILRFFFCLATNIYSIPSYFVWFLLLQPLRFLAPEVFWRLDAVLFKGLLAMISTWIYSGGYRIIEAGDDLSSLEEKEAIVLLNHLSTSDTVLIMTALQARGLVCGRVLWVMDYMFRFTNFGCISMCRGDFFIAQGKDTRQAQLTLFQKHLTDVYLPRYKKWIVLFPEGGFLRNRLTSSQNYAKKHGYPVLNHVTLPRTGAVKVILDTISEDENKPDANTSGDNGSKKPLKWIIDITIGYPNGKPLDAHGCILGWHPPTDTYLHYRAYPTTDIPRDLEGITSWMYQRYAEKDKLLENFYNTGVFEEAKDCVKRVLPSCRTGVLDIDVLQIIMFHVFYLVSSYIHFIYILKPILSLLGL